MDNLGKRFVCSELFGQRDEFKKEIELRKTGSTALAGWHDVERSEHAFPSRFFLIVA